MKSKVVLVVEDNADELMIYSTLLTHRGYAVLAARNFRAAYDMAIRHRPDAVIVDVNLGDPDRDGCDLIEALRSDPGTARLPVLAHTAYGDVYHQALERAGCVDILHKPADPAALVGTLERLIGPPGESAEA
jgi:CheY-like chemotaxis protein